MKKLVILVLALAVTFSLVGCNQKLGPGRPITAYIGNSVTSVDITPRWRGNGSMDSTGRRC